MAPVQRWAAASTTNQIYTRHHNHCSGWYCFTSAEQAGIIISAITVTMVALFLWMYVFGRITMAEKKEALRQGRKLQTRSITQHGAITLLQLPQVPRYPSCRITYIPVSYTQPGVLAAQPPTQSHPLMIPQQPVCMVIPVEPMAYGYPEPIHHSSIHHGNHPGDSVLHDPSAQTPNSSSYDPAPRQPTWARRIFRAFGLPVGRASTVETESALGSRTSSEARSEISQRDTQLSHLERPEQSNHGAAHDDQEHQENGDLTNISSGCNDTHPEDIDRIQSPVSIAATVHSDDYDTISTVNAANGGMKQSPSDPRPGGISTATDSVAILEGYASLVSSSGPSASSPAKRYCTSTPRVTGRQYTSHQQYSASL
jgi:hypothetical protein